MKILNLSNQQNKQLGILHTYILYISNSFLTIPYLSTGLTPGLHCVLAFSFFPSHVLGRMSACINSLVRHHR
jgi:hypothetical protein